MGSKAGKYKGFEDRAGGCGSIFLVLEKQGEHDIIGAVGNRVWSDYDDKRIFRAGYI